MDAPMSGEMAWYVTGRFYVAADTSLQDVGYFVHLQGIDGDLFCGEPGEATAHFTFSAQPFMSKKLFNADIQLGLDMVGNFSVFFNPQPVATFAEPQSFASGMEIAVFRRVSVVMGIGIGGGNSASNVFSARLLRSREFEFCGRRYDFRHLLPHGVTQWGSSSTAATAVPTGYSSAFPFAASAVAIGAGCNDGIGAL
jgi:hypothetical protein